MVRRIPVGKFPYYYAIVDDEDFYRLSLFKWWPHSTPTNITIYARRTDANGKHFSMHKMITGFDLTDHKNHNGLDNRRENLRFATGSQNQANKGKQKGFYSSRFKGVSWHNANKKWRARITRNGTMFELGHFLFEEDAAHAYDTAAKELFGEFSRINFPE